MYIKVITNDNEFDKIKDEWITFEEKINNQNLTTSYLFQRVWWKNFGSINNKQFGYNKKLLVLFLYNSDNKLIAIAPFCEVERKIRKIVSYNSIEFIGQQFGACYIDFVSNKLSKEEIDFIFNWLKKNRKYDLIKLQYIPEFTSNFNLKYDNVTILSACPEINISEFTDFDNYIEKNYDKNFKRNLKKRTRKLNTNYNTEFIIKDKTIVETDTWENIIKISNCKIEDSKHSHYNDENKKKYNLELFNAYKDSFLIFLYINQIPEAYQICIPYNNKNYFIDFSYNRKYRSYGIGNLVENFTVEYSFKNYNYICLGTGVDYYKLKFTKNLIKIYNYFEHGNTFKGNYIYNRKLELSKIKEKSLIKEIDSILPGFRK